jgi:hypothetical protein
MYSRSEVRAWLGDCLWWAAIVFFFFCAHTLFRAWNIPCIELGHGGTLDGWWLASAPGQGPEACA